MITGKDKIKGLGKERTLNKDDFLFQAEDPAAGFFYLEEGEIRVFKMDEQGKEVEVVRILPGDFLGEAIVFVRERFPSYAQAVKDSRVLYLEKEAFFEEVEKNPSLAKFFLTLLAEKCVVLNQRIEALELRTVRQRLIQYLLASCQGYGRCVIELPMRKMELAKRLGTVSETLSRNLKQLQDEGLISVRGSSIQVRDCARLREELRECSI